MTLWTWIAVAVVGPGALGVFVWFLRDLRSLLGDDARDDGGGDDESR
jgi:hypothetical protein